MKKNRLSHIFFKIGTAHIKERQLILLLSVVVGISAALAATLFKELVHHIRHFVTYLINVYYARYLFFVFPFIGIFLTIIFMKGVLKRMLGHGIPNVLYSISRNAARLKPSNIYASIIASSLTIGFGGSAGVEGPSAATGAAIGSNLAGLFRLKYSQRVLLLGAGTAAAIAAIFKAPITGIVFVIEILMLDLKFSNLVPLLVSTATATLVSYLILGKDIIYNIPTSYEISLTDIGLLVILAILAGFISFYYFKTYVFIHDFFEKYFNNMWHKLLAGGIGMGLLVFLLPPVYGEGFEFINNMLNGDFSHVVSHTLINIHQNPYIQFFIFFLLIILAKPIATSLTFAAGGVGGDFAPSLFIGANLGALFALLVNHFTGLHLNVTVFTLVGMASTLSGILHAPLTSIFLIAEITGGYNLLIPLMIVSALSFYTSTVLSNESIYTYKLSKRGDLITHNKDLSAINLIEIERLIEKNFRTISPNFKIKDLMEAFEQSTRNLFPVIDKDNRLLGVVVLDDIRKVLCRPEYAELPVSKFITELSDEEIIEITQDSTQSAINKFLHTGHYNLPVTQNGKYLGFISKANLFTKYREIVKTLTGEEN